MTFSRVNEKGAVHSPTAAEAFLTTVYILYANVTGYLALQELLRGSFI